MSALVVVLITGGVLLAIMVGGLVMVKSSIQSWLKGDEFESWLVKRASVVLRSEIDMADMTWEGSEVYSNRFRAMGYEGAAFSELNLDGVRAQIGSISDGAFMVPDVRVNRFGLVFSKQKLNRPDGVDLVADSEISGPQVPDWLKRFVPNRVEMGEVSLGAASVKVINEDGTMPFEMSGVAGSILPDFRTMMWEIKGKGGKLRIPDQPEIRLKNLAMRWKQTELFIDRCGLGIYDQGHIDGSGEISFAKEGNFDLNLDISAIDVDELLEGEWQERLAGTVEGPVRITGRPGSFLYEGTITVADAVVEKIPVLTVIAKYTKNEQFRYLVLSEARADFKKEGERIELRDLALQADGLVRVEGELDIEGELIAGRLQVGVTPGTLRWIPGAERQVFVESRDGFLWTPMTISGSVSDPKEDLSGRLIAAAGVAILKELPEGLLNEAQKFLDPGSATEGSGDLIEQGRGILDALSPFLKGP